MRYLLLVFILFFSVSTYADQAMLDRTDVQAYINKTSKELGITKANLETVCLSVIPRPAVIHQMKHPAEAMTWTRYQQITVTQQRIENGAKFWHEHAKVLADVEKKYHVPASIIVATIGIESNYGANKGNFRVIDALTDLAFNYPNRSTFFQYELTEFFILTMIEHPVDPLSIKGSYAGAIGWPQFMPHSIRSFGVDYSGDGKIDLSNDVNDIIASIGNYYHQHGWKYGSPIAVSAHTKEKGEATLVNLPLDSDKTEPWLCYPNFNVIMRYNKSPLYAMAVTQLSEKISHVYH